MDNQFDELSKSLAEGVSRREALRKFGLGIAGVLLATLGLSRAASAAPCPKGQVHCGNGKDGICCPYGYYCSNGACYPDCAILGCPTGYSCVNGACLRNCNILGCSSGYHCCNNYYCIPISDHCSGGM